MKKLILEQFLRTGKITEKQAAFCERYDWHPVDELPFQPDVLRKISGMKRERAIKLRSVADLLS